MVNKTPIFVQFCLMCGMNGTIHSSWHCKYNPKTQKNEKIRLIQEKCTNCKASRKGSPLSGYKILEQRKVK